MRATLSSQAAAPPPPSPYQTPPPGEENDALAAAPPGTPPVEPIEEIRPPKKRKAHAEPEDPYAPLGIRAGAFDLFPAVELSGGYSTNPGQSARGEGRRARERRARAEGAVELVAA